MPERLLHGTPASPGVAIGGAWRLAEDIRSGGPVLPDQRERERAAALAALAGAAEELAAVATGLPAEEAEMVEAGVLMAHDPSLHRAVEAATLTGGLPAADAIQLACGEHADAIAAIGDETLAARADDVRSLGRRAARIAAHADDPPPSGEVILLAHDLGPADVAELAPVLAGVALSGGGATAHAAIVARSLGIPMVTGLDEGVSEIAEGASLVLDGSGGSLIVAPSPERSRGAAGDMSSRRLAAQRAHVLRDEPAVTSDGTRITVLANVASPDELAVGLRAGAEGIGLLRTELGFLDAGDWPTEQEHAGLLARILAGLESRPVVVRVLDFGADKSPPFLRHVPQRGLELLLAHPDAFIRQLRAILLAAQRYDVRLLLPMVETPAQLAESRALVQHAARSLGIDRIPPLGSMVETPAAAQNAGAIARDSDFLSIGTNDLTAATLGVNRFAANGARAYHPHVLRSIAASVTAADEAGIVIEVCGEAASDPIMLPLLVGLGVDELSVGAARVGEVRDWIRRLNRAQSAGLARSALTMDTADEVEWAVGPLSADAVAKG
jgi:phosphoenolpyruvate-protein kinase (PTS system EI component)